jgi:K(+)-stimulated pyrophosphate-energized sodium pump
VKSVKCFLTLALFALGFSSPVWASEADLRIPDLSVGLDVLGTSVPGTYILYCGFLVTILGMIFGLVEYNRIKKLPAHGKMLEISELIYETCKTYMLQQGRFLIALQVLVGIAMIYYFSFLRGMSFDRVALILAWSVLGILGSYSVAWFGVRINTFANSRTAHASLQGQGLKILEIPLRAGMSIGVLLICTELVLLLSILLFVPSDLAGACFMGFAIGESLGASALRVAGGIFTKIADIGSDLMKITFNIKEDDARNPGVIADCTGDNAGDSVGPTADGFETYGVTAVALISFIILAVGKAMGPGGMGSELIKRPDGDVLQAKMIVWIFAMQILMVLTSLLAYYVNGLITASCSKKAKFDFEKPLTTLVWLTSIISILVTFAMSYILISYLGAGIWWKLSTIISCGTLAGALIPEFTKAFTSTNSRHVNEIVNASREGGASLTILSGLVAGNFGAFWTGLTIVGLMFVAYFTASLGLDAIMVYPSVFAFGLLAFGFLSMGPVTIAVDSYGPVTDNAQSVFELSQIEQVKPEDFKKEFGFLPNYELGKHLLEENDAAGNTFKATSKPVLIGTAVIGATTMIFSIILLLGLKLDLIDPRVLLGLITGGAVIYWFTGASMQAVTTGAYRAVEYIKDHINLESTERASVEDSKEVVKICTKYAQKGMINIFGVLFSFTLAFACFDPTFFASYLISIAVFGLFQAMFMANAGGAWDNAKKFVEVDLREKGTDLHAATVIGDTVGDPFKDTSSVALNPIIKFTTLFGLLAVEIAVSAHDVAVYIGGVLFIVGLFFVYRSFYGMRIRN